MKNKEKLFQTALSFLSVLFGNMLYALAVKLFLLPSGMITGGTTGIALIVTRFFDIPVSMFVLTFNIIMLLVGLAVLGRKFAATTVASSFVYPLSLDFFDRLLGNVVITENPLLCTVFAGLGIGLGLGMVIRMGASTGGMDIPPLILHKLMRIPVSGSMYAFDICILLGQALFHPAEMALYGILLVLIYTMVLDRVLLKGSTRIELKIISNYAAQITETILNEIDRGVTLLDAEGGYLHNKKQIVLTIISGRELAKVEKIIHSIDPESFIILSQVNEVSGRGFSMKKLYRSR